MPQKYGYTKTIRYKLVVSESTDILLTATTGQYSEVLAFFLQVFQEHQELLGVSDWLKTIERLTHRTAKNPYHLYPFDALFPRYPSGMRRAAIAEAYGEACSWSTRYTQWQRRKARAAEKNTWRLSRGKKAIEFKEHPPVYPESGNNWLTYYGTEFTILDPHHILLKVWTGKSYNYRKVALHQPLIIPEGHVSGTPTLIHKPNGWQLHIPVVLPKNAVSLLKVESRVKEPDFRMCVVDLGINNHVAMTIQDREGRVLTTRIISGRKDNHLRKSYLEQIVRLQKETQVIPDGERFAVALWNKIGNFNDNVAHKVSRVIVKIAQMYGAKTIVFEHLTNLKPSKGTKSHRLNQKFIFWVKGWIVKYTRYKALHEGIVVNRVSPRNTSNECPYCGGKLTRYQGVALAKCPECGVRDVNADYIGSLGIGRNFIKMWIA
ncbi:MAG: zinc ribbon domain-containing protein [Bacillota bacterium]